MIELGELERRHRDFEARRVRVIAVSNDDQETAQATQSDFSHVVIVADTQQNMAKAIEAVHAGAGPNKSDTTVPTTLLVDGAGTVRWTFRPRRVIARLSAEDLLAAIDETFSRAQ
jgi:peroxiredoxin